MLVLLQNGHGLGRSGLLIRASLTHRAAQGCASSLFKAPLNFSPDSRSQAVRLVSAILGFDVVKR